jgi:peptidoglycan/xylan/chitin deacetylase (PgdA/CDA1 family)
MAPDGLVVLTFDDSVASHATFVAPLLKKYGFGATFYITEGFEFLQDKVHYLTWEQIKGLHADGFEIGNHTRAHKGVNGQKPSEIAADLEHIEKRCVEYGIPVPTTFSYPATRPARPRLKSYAPVGICWPGRVGRGSSIRPRTIR